MLTHTQTQEVQLRVDGVLHVHAMASATAEPLDQISPLFYAVKALL